MRRVRQVPQDTIVLGLKAACVSCHKDPHRGTLGPNCATCHSTAVAFKETEKAFDHSKTAFPLSGRTSGGVREVPRQQGLQGHEVRACTDCHKDPHRQPFGAVRRLPHRRDLEDRRSTTRRPASRSAASTAVACVSCHGQPPTGEARVRPVRGLPRRSSQGLFKQDCVACHTEDGFKSAAFDHGAKTGSPSRATTPSSPAPRATRARGRPAQGPRAPSISAASRRAPRAIRTFTRASSDRLRHLPRRTSFRIRCSGTQPPSSSAARTPRSRARSATAAGARRPAGEPGASVQRGLRSPASLATGTFIWGSWKALRDLPLGRGGKVPRRLLRTPRAGSR